VDRAGDSHSWNYADPALFEFLRLRSIEQALQQRVIYKEGHHQPQIRGDEAELHRNRGNRSGIAGRIFGFGDVTVTGGG